MFGMGMPEILLILAVALIVIGPKKLPDLAKSLGRAIGEFRKATSDLKESMVDDSPLKDVKNAFQDLNDGINNPLATPSASDQTDTPVDEFERPTPEAPLTSSGNTKNSDAPETDQNLDPKPDKDA